MGLHHLGLWIQVAQEVLPSELPVYSLYMLFCGLTWHGLLRSAKTAAGAGVAAGYLSFQFHSFFTAVQVNVSATGGSNAVE